MAERRLHLRRRGRRIIRATLATVVLLGAGVATLHDPAIVRGIPSDPTEDPGPSNCQRRPLSLSVTLKVVGLPLARSQIVIDASNARLVGVQVDCEILVADVPRHSWSIVSRPAGSTASLGGGGLTQRFTPDRAGQYRIRFTSCPGGCRVTVEGAPAQSVPAQSAEILVTVSDTVVLPPDVEPTLPPQTATQPTNFPDSERKAKCSGGGGVIDPQWVTVNRFSGASDYQLLEGRVFRSASSTTDNPLNHSTLDFNFTIRPDPPYRRLVSTKPEFPDPTLMATEWERSSYPDRVRPTPGDRVSVFGYWIFDCGHPPFYTEIHPPVGFAVHRPRAVQIPTSFRPPGFPNGFGTNVIVPGIVTDVWFNRNGGTVTACRATSLHQPSGGSCIRAPSPVNRIFRFSIYLPRNPQAILAAAGRTVPRVPLYVRVEGTGGPTLSASLREQGGASWLDAFVDLSSLTGSTYSRRIVAAWAYPSATNWDARRWRLTLKSLDVDDDGDCCGKGDGDWRFWINTNNLGQEWTMLYNCDGCVHGVETMPSAARTGAGLGPDLVLFPSQRIWVSTSGYDEDVAEHTDVGTVAVLLDQANAAGARSAASSCSGWDCGEYTLNYELASSSPGGAALTPEARALADAYTVGGDRPPCRPIKGGCVVLPGQELAAVYHVIESSRPTLRRAGRASKVHPPLFEPQETETFALTGASADALNRRITTVQRQRARAPQLEQFLDDVAEQLRSVRRRKKFEGEFEPALAYYRRALPPNLYARLEAKLRAP